MPYQVHGGRVITDEQEPLRTKIVATIGSPTSYGGGFVRLDGRITDPAQLTFDFLVRQFFLNGVDVIRLNLAHVPVEQIPEVYSNIRQAVLACEREKGGFKRIAVLADLPGPKIRFNFEAPVRFELDAPFTVHFEQAANAEGRHAGLVFVGRKPLKEAMDDVDRGWKSLSLTDLAARGLRRDLVENVIGLRVVDPGHPKESYATMMRSVANYLNSGEDVLIRIGDGEVVLKVNPHGFDTSAGSIACTVLTVKEATLEGRRAFTFKGIDLEIPSFTAEDAAKLDALLGSEYSSYRDGDWQPVLSFIALSFSQTADDILRTQYHLRERLHEHAKRLGPSSFERPAVIAKIESQKGWRNIDLILDVADGAMVARGDLGLQMEIERIPAIQKRLIQLCNQRGKPVITATEMLKSMTASIEPTRAEGSDVFNAIIDGSDAVMMSEETSKGRYPLHSIYKMISVAIEAERYFEGDLEQSAIQRSKEHLQRYQAFLRGASQIIARADQRFKEILSLLAIPHAGVLGNYITPRRLEFEWRLSLYQEKANKSARQPTTDRITEATCTMSEAAEIRGILAATTSGRTARMIVRMRPRVVVIGAAHDVLNVRKLMASFGVWPICIGKVTDKEGAEGMFQRCLEQIQNDEALNALLRDREVIFTAGTPVETPGTTNLIQIKRYELTVRP